MMARLRSWWQKTEKPLEILGIIIAIIAGIVLIFVVVHLNGTGFDGYTQTSISTDITPPPHKITRTEVYQSGKTLWDWLQLLIIPLVLAIGGYAFNLTVSRNERKAAANRDQTERDIAADNQREDALQEYIDKMSQLLLDRKLRESADDDEARKIARVRTLTVLPRLDGVRKRSVLQFLYESALLDKDKSIVNLNGANLSGANLSGAFLYNATLSGANLSDADLSDADLSKANLSGANLGGADLSRATLSGADLSGADLSGATLSDANLNNANFSDATLSGAELSGATLSDATLSRADLSGAFLGGANLSGATLSRANLRHAFGISIAALENQAKSLYDAIMPDGSIHS